MGDMTPPRRKVKLTPGMKGQGGVKLFCASLSQGKMGKGSELNNDVSYLYTCGVRSDGLKVRCVCVCVVHLPLPSFYPFHSVLTVPM
jgi:hypothetical protein